ncbi:MAG: hypothetical protein IKU10_00345 [Clostridia bacterium]|nr:hypothetical protein [Clostridia bacterium]
MKKAFHSYLTIWAILLFLFNIIAFVSGGLLNQEKYDASFWVGYIFITLAFVGQLVCAKIAFDANNLQKLFYNFPLISLSWTGLILSFVIAGICMLVPTLPYWVGIIACSIVLAFVAIAIVKANVAADAVSAIDEKIKMQTFFIKSLTVDAEGLIARATTDEIKLECKKVYEAVRFSDPMSHDMLSATESQITIKFSELSDAVNASNYDAVKALAREAIILMNDRNNRCKLLK